MGGPVEVAGDQLRAIVERIEHIEEEIKELNEGKREIFQEAKSKGLMLRSFERSSGCESKTRRSARSTRFRPRGLFEGDQGRSRLEGRLILSTDKASRDRGPTLQLP